MLIISLLKGVPARTTQIVTVGGVLNREQMEIVMNPHDKKTIEAADYIKRIRGGKIVLVSMGPDAKLTPIIKGLFHSEVEGIDEAVILSDRKMAGADTWATSYTIAKGIKKILAVNKTAVDRLIAALRETKESFQKTAEDLYTANLLPNKIYSPLPSVKDSIVTQLVQGKRSLDETERMLVDEKQNLLQFVIVTGIKSTDGETGSVGPQLAEALSNELGTTIPHVTYIHDFIISGRNTVSAERKILGKLERVRIPFPCLVTIADEYRSRSVPSAAKKEVRANSYGGKILQPQVWNCDQIEADASKVGLAGSPTLVGPGYDIGGPRVRKMVGQSIVTVREVKAFNINGKSYGPFKKGDLVDGLDQRALEHLKQGDDIDTFDYKDLITDLFG
ncbi:MAG: hypothetical protein HYU39_00960 [Thaumarchaeota archaeon]|nr:hypothetical protein [Nitrososphaerota archaeon]